MFLFKKFVGLLVAPLGITLLLTAIAAVLYWRRRVRTVPWLLGAAIAVMYLSSIELVSDALMLPLERRYPRLAEERAPPGVQHVVVLGSTYWPRWHVPITAAIGSQGIVRVIEGIRLHRKLGIPHLVLSGGRALSPAPSAHGYAELARQLGVDENAITMLDSPNDTAEEAAAVKALLGDAPFILVTSAYHMPRAVRLMEEAGAHPIPAPTGHRGTTADGLLGSNWIPRARALAKTEDALHEYLGLLALSMGIR